jgi:hypothetical protein
MPQCIQCMVRDRKLPVAGLHGAQQNIGIYKHHSLQTAIFVDGLTAYCFI